jgi:YggT family protein
MPHKWVFSVSYRGFFMSVGNAFFAAVLEVVYAILDFYVWAVILSAILSWLVSFGVVNPYNRVVHVVGDMLARITEPLLAPIRRHLPNMGGLDLSPLVLIFIVYFVQSFIRHWVL